MSKELQGKIVSIKYLAIALVTVIIFGLTCVALLDGRQHIRPYVTTQHDGYRTETHIKSRMYAHAHRREVTFTRTSCTDVKFSSINHLPATALASFPGSGNTWTRHLLELATGMHNECLLWYILHG